MKLQKIEITMGATLAFIVILVTLIVINTKHSNIKYEKSLSSIKEEAYRMSDSVALADTMTSSNSLVKSKVQQEQANGSFEEGSAEKIAEANKKEVKEAETKKLKEQESQKQEAKKQEVKKTESNKETSVSYRNQSAEEIGRKIDSLLKKSTLNGKGTYFASKALEIGVDPYLATAVMLHETGCYWECSNLVRTKYNLGGLRSNGGYRSFSSLESGIDGYLTILYKNYYSKGLTTPEKMAKKYTGQANPSSWISKVHWYMTKLEKA